MKNNREVNVEGTKTCTLNTKKGILSKGIPESSMENEGLAEKSQGNQLFLNMERRS
jgi:hypothetical protein